MLPRLVASAGSQRDNVAREGYQHRRSDSLTGSTVGTPRQRQDSSSGSGTFTPFSPTENRFHAPYRDSIDSLDEPTRRPVGPFRPATGSSSNKSSYQSSLLGLTKLGMRPTSSSSEAHMRMESVGERATLVDPDEILVHEGKSILGNDGIYAVRAEDVEAGRAFHDAPVHGSPTGLHDTDYPIPSLISQDPPSPGPLQRNLERLLNPLRRNKAVARLERFIDGPKPARQLVIRPWLPRLEAFLFRLCRPFSYPRFPLLTIVFLAGWILGNVFLTRASWYTSSTNFGTPNVLGCTDALWAQNADCGLNGTACAPFSDHFYPFRCPAGCASVQVLNTRTVGDIGVIYSPFVVGGGSFNDPETSADTNATYRADSFICQAALHAGLFSDDRGGCGVVTQVGSGSDYTTSDRNGIKGTFYEGSFVSSFQFWGGVEQSGCRDLRWEILTFNVVMSFVFSLVLRPFPVRPLSELLVDSMR